MSNQLLKYTGGVLNSDSQATAGAAVERDSIGDTYQKGVNAATYLATAGSFFAHGKNYTTTATLDGTATVAKGNATAGAFTITLPPAATATDQVYVVVKTDASANAVTVKGNGSELINGANTFALSAQYNVARFWCDGTQWYLI